MTTPEATEPKQQEEEKKDFFTTEAVRALGATEKALVAVARFLDHRAKAVHDLAIKLDAKATDAAPTTPA